MNCKMLEILDDIEYNQFDSNELYMNVFPKGNLNTDLVTSNKNRPEVNKKRCKSSFRKLLNTVEQEVVSSNFISNGIDCVSLLNKPFQKAQ